jgi:hypothetical protein
MGGAIVDGTDCALAVEVKKLDQVHGTAPSRGSEARFEA